MVVNLISAHDAWLKLTIFLSFYKANIIIFIKIRHITLFFTKLYLYLYTHVDAKGNIKSAVKI